MTVKKFLESTYTDERFQVRPAVGCKDGLTLSIQGGSSSHYCRPARKCNIYEAVEVGFPSARVDELLPYADNPSDPTGTVYGFVPMDVIEEVVAKHGGIVATVHYKAVEE